MPKFFIKVENWKGRRIHVARDEKGLIFSRRLYTKAFNKQAAIEKFKKDRSFQKNKRVILLGRQKKGNIKEEISYMQVKDIDNPKRLARIPQDRDMYQYFIIAYIKDGTEIAARSERHERSFSRSKAREEALKNFYMRLSEAYGFDYDMIDGINVYQREIEDLKVEEGIITYASIA